MSFVCFACFEPFTNRGTAHSLYTTKCGHLIGLSCWENWKLSTINNNLRCFNCLRGMARGDCHPIYNIPDEILCPNHDGSLKTLLDNDSVEEQYLSKKFKQLPIFLKTLINNVDGTIELFDGYNGYILVASLNLPKRKISKYVRVLSCHNEGECDVELYEQSPLTAAAFNKCRKDVVEFGIGFKSGYVQIITCSLDLSQVISSVACSCNYGKIQSMSFTEKDKIVYSVEEYGIVVAETSILKSTSWVNLKDSERCNITDLQRFADNVLLGRIDNSIYVFEKSENSYVIYHDVDKTIINFTIDVPTNMLLIFCSEDETIDGSTITSYFYVLCKIKEGTSKKNKISAKNKYQASVIKIIKANSKYLGTSIRNGVLFFKGDERLSMYSFVPNARKNVLEAFYINNRLDCISVEGFENLNDCRGVLCINEPTMLSSGFFKVNIALIFSSKVVVLNFYCPVKD